MRSLIARRPAAGNRRDPLGERPNERAERRCGQGSIDPAVPFGEVCVVVLGAQQDLEGAGAPHQPGEVLGGAAAGDLTERRLELREDRRFARGEAHVAGEHELAASRAHAALDLRDGDEAACAQVAEQERDRRYTGEFRRFLPVLRDSRQVDMRDEVVRVAALEHQHLVCVVCFGSLDQGDEIANQLRAEEIHGWSEDLRKQNRPVYVHGDGLERPLIPCR